MEDRVIPFVHFVGDRPTKDNISQLDPFVGTKSYKTLLSWIYRLDVSVSRCLLKNAYDINGREEVMNIPAHDKVVALGDVASKRLDELKQSHFKLPHPSGLNRKLNDKDFLDSKLQECKDWLYAKP